MKSRLHLCRWIHDACLEHDSRPFLTPPACITAASSSAAQHALSGMAELAAPAQLPEAHVQQLEAQILSLGAVDVRELRRSDWQSLIAFNALKPFEQRRLLAAVDSA